MKFVKFHKQKSDIASQITHFQPLSKNPNPTSVIVQSTESYLKIIIIKNRQPIRKVCFSMDNTQLVRNMKHF